MALSKAYIRISFLRYIFSIISLFLANKISHYDSMVYFCINIFTCSENRIMCRSFNKKKTRRHVTLPSADYSTSGANLNTYYKCFVWVPTWHASVYLFIYFAFTHLSLCLFIRGNLFTDGCICLEFLKVKSVVMRRLELIESSVPAYSLYPQFKSRLGWNFDFAICWTNQ